MARAPDLGAHQANFPSVHGQLCGLGCASSMFVCLSWFFLPVVCMKLATYICVASTCERNPRAHAELWAVSCLILLVIFCQVLNFRVCIPFPVPSWTGPVPGEQNGSARKLLLPDALHHCWAGGGCRTAFQTAARMPSPGISSAPVPGCNTRLV